MKYLICKKQVGIGCDYTIGCGMRFDFIEADSVQDAIEKTVFPDGRGEISSLEGENALEKIFIIPSENVMSVDISPILDEIEQQRTRELKKRQEAQELAEFERLKMKYG